MLTLTPSSSARLPRPCRDENEVLRALVSAVTPVLAWPEVVARARPWVQAVRDQPAPFWAMESLLREYPITSAEGLALMRLAEALLRVPDTQTAIALTADQLGRARFDGHQGEGHGPHQLLASLSAKAIALSKKFLPDAASAGNAGGLLQRLGSHTVVAATVRAIELMGRQFVLGRHIGEAMTEAASARRVQSGLRFSYDMLGEGARTEADATRYLAAYRNAILAIADGHVASSPQAGDGISIKLSALFSRYEEAQRERVFSELLPRVWRLIEVAAPANINLTIDAEESDRLELSLDVFDALAQRIAATYPQWQGFGLAVQAYQTRALQVIQEVARIGRRHQLGFMVRLVKGAYWDGEIKRAQEMGLEGYPVYTHKHHTDISYLACAQALLDLAPVRGQSPSLGAGQIYPQFATHNAGTIAAILLMADKRGATFEMQRLHGMGEGVYREVMKDAAVPVRVYAPVGEHRDLLAYLVRRLLENGANSSFVHQLTDEAVDIEQLLANPLRPVAESGVVLPLAMFEGRRNSKGLDLSNAVERLPIEQAIAATELPMIPEATLTQAHAAVTNLKQGYLTWNAIPVSQRAHVLREAAEQLESRCVEFCGLLVREAHKTMGDCVAEVREAVDFLRYYADQAEDLKDDFGLSHPDGLGVFVCISPWNFPLAIFAGQVAAALVMGNAVAAKPAEQTPVVAARMVALMHDAGVPQDALVMLHGPGETVGAALVAHPDVVGVCFTGSTAVAQIIHRTLADKQSSRRQPVLIAETGGINAMVVDSSALPEQVVDAVVQSAFRSAGQRCSALRLLCVHESVADAVIEMIRGALLELSVNDPALFSTDVGPVIDDEAFDGIRNHVARLRRQARWIGETPMTSHVPRLIAPIAFELNRIADVTQEIFGPVLHVVRWSGDVESVVQQINALGYGLTLGLQTRIDSRALRLAAQARIGNVYVNRNMIGAVVGVQPFGGEGLSGTGPKAGGPHYLLRFCTDPAQSEPIRLPPTLSTESLAIDRGLEFRAREIMSRLSEAGRAWRDRPVTERMQVLSRATVLLEGAFSQSLNEDSRWEIDVKNAWHSLARQAGTRLASQRLPGPTGECNELHLHARGVFAVVVPAQARPLVVAQHLAAALVTGNAVVWWAQSPAAWHQALLSVWAEAGLPQDVLLSRADLDDLTDHAGMVALLNDVDLSGVALDDATMVTGVASLLARRPGALVPLIDSAPVSSGDGAAIGRLLLRFVAEQTVTINTAAAGGNVELLAQTV